MALVPLWLLAAAGPGPCAPVEPGPAADPATALEYLAVGDSQRAADARSSAAAAYRAAAALDPGNERARVALDELCGEATRSELFAEASKLMEGGDRRGAIAAFARLRAAGPSPAASLLEGICRYELGESAEAARRLAEARADPDFASAAEFFLGLLALREGDAASAARSFEAVGPDSGLLRAAADLASLSRREGRLTLVAALESGFDSNPDLSASDQAPEAGAPLGLSALVLARPWGPSGPFAQASGGYRAYLPLHAAAEPGLLGGAIGWRLSRPEAFLSAEYGFDFFTYGRASQLASHRALVEALLSGERLFAEARYLHRWDFALAAAEVGNSGNRDAGELSAGWRLRPGSSLSLGYALSRHLANEPSALEFPSADERLRRQRALSYLEHGPRLEVRLEPRPGLRLSVSGALRLRDYDGEDPDLLLQREDRSLEARGRAELDLSEPWTVFLAAEARQVSSNIPELESVRFTGSLGIALAAGVL